LTISGLQAEDE
nr:immunoglobulin light chain junction region [Homo sapiens]MCA55077.1 immunoglobulin light chain junction region [Homo sapiens]